MATSGTWEPAAEDVWRRYYAKYPEVRVRRACEHAFERVCGHTYRFKYETVSWCDSLMCLNLLTLGNLRSVCRNVCKRGTRARLSWQPKLPRRIQAPTPPLRLHSAILLPFLRQHPHSRTRHRVLRWRRAWMMGEWLLSSDYYFLRAAFAADVGEIKCICIKLQYNSL